MKYYYGFFNIFFNIVLSASVVSCAGGVGGTEDTTKPTVTSTSPANGATDVGIDSTITVAFNKAMDVNTLTVSNFYLDQSVTGTVTYDVATQTATFTPSANLTYSATYTVTVLNSVQDITGNNLNKNYSWQFSTVVDSTAPTTIASPPGGIYTTAQSVTLTCNDQSESGCAAIFYTFDGSTPTLSSAQYADAITISSNTTLKFFAVDTVGNIESVKSASYIIDTAAPTISVSPAASEGPFNYDLSLTLICTDSGRAGCGNIYYTLDGTTPTRSSAVYSDPIVLTASATLNAFSVDRADNASPVLSEDYVIDKIPPTVQSVSPADGTDDVELVNVPIEAAISEPINCLTVNGTTFTLLADNTVPAGLRQIPGQVDCVNSNTVRFIPDNSLPSDARITATLTTGLQDLAKNPLGSDVGWEFHTRPWTIRIGTPGGEWGTVGTAIDAKGNIYVVGNTDAAFPTYNNLGSWDVFIAKYRPTGDYGLTLEWLLQTGTAETEKAGGVAVDPLNNIYVVGTTRGDIDGAGPEVNAGEDDVFIMKIDFDGNILWLDQFGSSAAEYDPVVVSNSEGRPYISGRTYGDLPGNTNGGTATFATTDIFLASYTAAGTRSFIKQLPADHFEWAGERMAVDSRDNIYVAVRVDSRTSNFLGLPPTNTNDGSGQL